MRYYQATDVIRDVFACITDLRERDGVGAVFGGEEHRYRIRWQDLCRLAEEHAGVADAHEWDVRAAASLFDNLGLPYSGIWVELDDWGEWQVYWD